jgi:hypothetical protein
MVTTDSLVECIWRLLLKWALAFGVTQTAAIEGIVA